MLSIRRSFLALAKRRFSSAAAAAANPNCPPANLRVARGLVVGMYEKEAEVDKPRLTKGGMKFNDKVGGKLMELMLNAFISGKLGQNVTFTNMGEDISVVTVVGIGKTNEGYYDVEALDVDRENIRVAVSIGVHRLERQNCTHIFVDGMDFPEQAAESSALTVWKYQDNIMPENRRPTAPIECYDQGDLEGWKMGLIKADAQNLVRRWCDMPANQMTPIQFAQASVEALCPLGINVEVRNLNWIEANGFNAFLAVARSSCEPPIMLELTYCKGGGDDRPILLCGQGLTFNSGGICLKKAEGMLEYRANMAGAAMCAGALQAIASTGLNAKINAVIPLCENMPSGMAVKPGDVINIRNGKSICVHDSNEIGGLMMLDALLYGQNAYSPQTVIDIGAYTDEIEAALSGSGAGVFTKSNCLWTEIEKSSGLTGDRLWRMPVWNYQTRKVTDYLKYDVSNSGHGHERGMPSKTAAVVSEFVPNPDWIHMDVRGVGMLSKNDIYPYCIQGAMSGRPTRTLVEFLYQRALAAST